LKGWEERGREGTGWEGRFGGRGKGGTEDNTRRGKGGG